MNREQLVADVRWMRQGADAVVRAHARAITTLVDQAAIDAICKALGEISIDEAIAALDQLQIEAAGRT